MMQRKKSFGVGGLSHSAPQVKDDDDGGSTKKKTTRLTFASRIMSKSASNYCLPGVPTAFKLILLSFVGFAFLVVFTAKGQHKHWHYYHLRAPNNMPMREPHMPEPLLDKVQRHMERSKGGAAKSVHGKKAPNDGSISSLDATQRMLAQPSRFVDSEKKLKHQLLKLLERQNAELKNKPKDPNDGVLGVKISNRYLGEDLLPYPDSRSDEKEWEKRMEARKANLERRDKQEWNEMMFRYDEVMEKYEDFYHPLESHQEDEDDNDPVDSHDAGSERNADRRKANLVDDGDTSADTAPVRPHRGTTQWPSPSEKAGPDTTILLKPAFGSHRPSNDAILVFAEGYDLSIYLAFVESLIGTGYSGDLVLSISAKEKLKPDVKKYLQSINSKAGGVNIVAYEVDWSCFKQSGEAVADSNGGVSHCKMNNVFGDAYGNPVSDPREPRPVATARYEIYWIWSLHYKKESWLMLIDARDAWFQLHPFGDLIRRGKVSGELHLFGENADAVRIGTSSFNRGWLITAYGEKSVLPYYQQPVMCSGSTIGNQNAIETYLRAMVAQFDTTLCKSKGCDQGFHNYLYYSGKLGTTGSEGGVEGISKVIVHDQGKGIINNLAALRTRPLSEWGLYDSKRELVLNWDGTTSAVVHQYDRDKEVNVMVKGRKRQFESTWSSSKYA